MKSSAGYDLARGGGSLHVITMQLIICPFDKFVEPAVRQADEAQEDVHRERKGEVGHDVAIGALGLDGLDQRHRALAHRGLHLHHLARREERIEHRAIRRMTGRIDLQRDHRPILAKRGSEDRAMAGEAFRILEHAALILRTRNHPGAPARPRIVRRVEDPRPLMEMADRTLRIAAARRRHARRGEQVEVSDHLGRDMCGYFVRGACHASLSCGALMLKPDYLEWQRMKTEIALQCNFAIAGACCDPLNADRMLQSRVWRDFRVVR
jgi:hypothetical protein